MGLVGILLFKNMSGWYFLFGFLGCVIGLIYGLIKGDKSDKVSAALSCSFVGCIGGLGLLFILNTKGIARKIGIRDDVEERKERNKAYEKNMDALMKMSNMVDKQKEESFGINEASKWLWNKISKANEYKVIEDWPGTDMKMENTYNHIKTLNVEYTGESDLNMEIFRFIASGITDEDESFHYEFEVEKINGHYGINNTDAPRMFYK